MIDWYNVKLKDRESDKSDRHMRKAIPMHNSNNMNRNDGSY